jgi:hypothetical protein
MESRVITPKQHGINDYLFSAALLSLPSILGFKKKTIKLYAGLGLNLFLYNALTDHPAGIKKLISYRTHFKIDVGNVAALALLTLYKGINKRPKTLAFHTVFTGLAAINVVLTDWKTPPDTNRYLFI